MECTDKSVELLLPDLAAGKLGEPDKQRVDTHVTECASCRKLLTIIVLLSSRRESVSESPEPEGDSAGHLMARQIASIYSVPDTLTESEQTEIRKHLASCPDCAAELDFLTSMELDLRNAEPSASAGPAEGANPTTHRSRRMPARVFAIAAIVLVTATTIWVWQSEKSDQVSSGITVLRELSRGAAETPIVIRQSGKPFVRVDAPVPHNNKLFTYQVSIRFVDGSILNAPVTTDFATPLLIHMIVDSRTLADGDYDLAMREIDQKTNTEVTYHFPLILRTIE